MFCKIMKFSKIRALSILLIILLMLFAGCASSTAIKQTGQEQADQKAGESLNLITDISTAEGSESLAILIKAERLLTYTSVKQPVPLGVALYFPATALGEIKTALTLDSDIVASIKASELTENGHTSRIEIALKKDAPYEVFREGNGLQISFAKGIRTKASAEPLAEREKNQEDKLKIKPAEVTMPAETAPEEDKDEKPAWVNRVDFSSEDAGKSTIIIGTTIPVKYKMNKAAEKRLQLILFNTSLPDYRKRPLITTRFNSAVDCITPMQTPALKTSSMIAIELRESVPYYIEQAKDILLVHFDASSIPPKPFEQADLPSWKKAMAQTAVEPTLRKAQKPVKRTGPVSAPTGGIVIETPLDAADYDIDAQRRIDAYTGAETELDVFRSYKTKKMYTGEKIALDFYDTDIKNVFRILMEISGKNFAIDKDVTGKVTLTLAKPVPWDQALDLILKMNQLGRTSEGDIIRIATLETLKKEEAFRQAEISATLKAREEQKVLEPLVTEYIVVNYADVTNDIEPHLKEIITKDRGNVTVDKRNNQIIITDVAEKVELARTIVRRIDKVTPQVIIEARIVEATTNFSREIGVEWNAAGGIQNDAANAGIGPQRSYDTLGGTYGYDMAMNLPIKANPAATIGFNFLRIAGTPFLLNAKLLAMESQGEGKIISAPKIVTLDNKKAVIKQGLRYPYNKLDESGNTITVFEDIDLVLEVRPHVTPDQRISMMINISKKDLGTEIHGQQSFTTKEASTELLVNNGNTVVIGGIIKTTKQFDTKGVPWLSKIPVLGWLFKSQTKKDEKEELLIFITPQIVRLEQRELIDDL
ncbi:MAG: type IV pilus secretin PilQ [Thermodesulfobacteriota bacterium]|nr:type IV pilus secretin PilQ [Thermodesulfobacteriota bacterium]